MRSLAVLGGGGFIGTNLCLRLAGQGVAVRALSRHFIAPLPASVECLTGDFGDESLVRRAVQGCDAVVHLALGITPQSSVATMQEDLRTALLQTIRLAELCQAAGSRLLFLSSGGTVYGVPRTVPTPEDAPCDPISPYGVVTLTIEKYLGVLAHLQGLDYRVLRVANPYGPHQRVHKGQGVIAAFLAAAAAGRPIEIWGDGSVVRDYLYIDDLLRAIELAAAHRGPGRVFNIGSGQGTRLADIAVAIERLLDRRLQRLRREGRKVDVPVSILDISAAGRELGWAPQVPLAEGLGRTWDWVQAPCRALGATPA